MGAVILRRLLALVPLVLLTAGLGLVLSLLNVVFRAVGRAIRGTVGGAIGPHAAVSSACVTALSASEECEARSE